MQNALYAIRMFLESNQGFEAFFDPLIAELDIEIGILEDILSEEKEVYEAGLEPRVKWEVIKEAVNEAIESEGIFTENKGDFVQDAEWA